MSQSRPLFSPLTHLGNISIETFLAEYWQKKPLLIRRAFADFEALISADELAGLSLEEEVVSRLITQRNQSWQVEHGPINESAFAALPEQNWTLLVQHADSLDPRINPLLEAFRFIPNWRLDDIMISYASDGGGVGPHFDYYDVFLLQAEGQRRWQIGQHCDSQSPLLPDVPMKILQEFHGVEDWVLEPGDMLYIPANVAHWGEAIGECMTYSVGFRAPSHADFILDYAQEVASRLSEDQRYTDPTHTTRNNTGEIAPEEIQRLREILQSISADDQALAAWLGQYSTQLKQPVADMIDACSMAQVLANSPCQLSPFNRVSYHSHGGSSQCFINGDQFSCSESLAVKLSTYAVIHHSECNQKDQQLLLELVELGLLTRSAQ